MKSTLHKLIVISVIFIIIFNVGFPIMVQASVDVEQSFDEAGVEQTWTDIGGNVIDGVVGFLTWTTRAPLAAVSIVLQSVLTQICGLGSSGAVLTAEDIIFTGSSRENTVNIIDINFFDFSTTGAAQESLVKNFREGVAKWYFALRNLSIVTSLVVLIYMGIRMAISSIASDKAKYKQMIMDWLVGFAVLFFLHYFMIIILNLNNQLVDIIYNINKADTSTFREYSSSLMRMAFSVSFVKGWGGLLIYWILIGTTLALFVMYIKRLFTVGFLIVISPLITVTYSIDKLGDGKSQALSTWMKEFTYNILIQPFHCIIYIIFVSSAISALNDSPSLGNLIFAALSVLFIFKAEDIVKTIFGFRANSLEGMATSGALAAGAIQKLSSAGGKAKKATGKVQSSKGKSDIKRKAIPSNGSQTKPQNSQPKTSSGTMQNTSTNSTQSNKNTKTSKWDGFKNSSVGRALSDYKDEKINNLKEFTSDPLSAMKTGAKQIGIRSLAATTKLAPKLVTGALMAGATGNGMNGIITGYATTGGKYTRKLSTALDKKANKIDIDGKEIKKLATAYERFRMQNNDLSDDELYNKTADLLESDISELTDTNEIMLAKQLQKMQQKYELIGVKKPAKNVMKKVEDIQLGKIDNNSIDISLDHVKVAAENLKNGDSGMSNDAIIDKAKDLINDMKTNQGNYLRSAGYKGLDKDVKKLAKEIYKSRDVITAIGNVPEDVVNDEVMKAIEEGISDNNA